MKKQENTENTFFKRVVSRLKPGSPPTDDRGRMLMVVNNLILHLHPSKVDARTLKWTYTWGLGGLAALLMVLLGLTGVLLQANYTPSAPDAYLNILALNSNVWFGALIRNIHHWSANLMILVSALHLLRVFFTGAYRPPRETNWLIGVGMLLLVLFGNFTGYLLPWDQLAFWAITVGTSVLSYVPLIGDALSRLLLGGPEVGAPTLLKFYSLHISFVPLGIFGLASFHFWRIRKDGGLSIPRKIKDDAPKKPVRVTTIPYLIRRETIWALFWIAALLLFSMFVNAPLEGIANPDISPNPAKAPWYFLGLQELLLHFHPLVGAIIIPSIFFIALAMLPFYDVNTENVGIYFRSKRGRWLTVLAAGISLVSTPLWVVLDEFVIHWDAWLPTWDSLISNGFVPLAVIALGLIMMDEWVKNKFKASTEERVLFLFIFIFVAILILTIIGIYFRGPGMGLYWPWDMPLAH